MSLNCRCARPGTGFLSIGKSQMTITCQANKQWSLNEIEACKVVPCLESPPKKPTGGVLFYDPERVKYRCPDGFQFKEAGFPFFWVNCTAAGTWLPEVVESCKGKCTLIY